MTETIKIPDSFMEALLGEDVEEGTYSWPLLQYLVYADSDFSFADDIDCYEATYRLILWAYKYQVEIHYHPTPKGKDFIVHFDDYSGKPGRHTQVLTDDVTHAILMFCLNLYKNEGRTAQCKS